MYYRSHNTWMIIIENRTDDTWWTKRKWWRWRGIGEEMWRCEVLIIPLRCAWATFVWLCCLREAAAMPSKWLSLGAKKYSKNKNKTIYIHCYNKWEKVVEEVRPLVILLKLLESVLKYMHASKGCGEQLTYVMPFTNVHHDLSFHHLCNIPQCPAFLLDKVLDLCDPFLNPYHIPCPTLHQIVCPTPLWAASL